MGQGYARLCRTASAAVTSHEAGGGEE